MNEEIQSEVINRYLQKSNEEKIKVGVISVFVGFLLGILISRVRKS